jgi:Fe-S cluster assembly iron-binding protein IscA
MLAMTDNAIDAIKRVAPGDAGLRLFASDATGGAGNALNLEVTEEPRQEDHVVDVQGAHVFLEPKAATLVKDKVLDAWLEDTKVRFALVDQR